MSERNTQFGQLDPQDLADAPDVEVDPDNQADIAEELAEEAGVDPSPQQVDAYLSLQEDDGALNEYDNTASE